MPYVCQNSLQALGSRALGFSNLKVEGAPKGARIHSDLRKSQERRATATAPGASPRRPAERMCLLHPDAPYGRGPLAWGQDHGRQRRPAFGLENTQRFTPSPRRSRGASAPPGPSLLPRSQAATGDRPRRDSAVTVPTALAQDRTSSQDPTCGPVNLPQTGRGIEEPVPCLIRTSPTTKS